jgi:hypothetical protein
VNQHHARVAANATWSFKSTQFWLISMAAKQHFTSSISPAAKNKTWMSRMSVRFPTQKKLNFCWNSTSSGRSLMWPVLIDRLRHARDRSFDHSDRVVEWAIATKPQPQNIWKGGALTWEDSKDYLYARTTSAGRIIIGGEDSDEVVESEERDRLIPQKANALAQKLAALWPAATIDIEYRWSGTFDTTSDGLPLIGPVPGAKGIYAAYGYGGNGITFSFLAAQLIGDLIAGSRSQLLDDFALDRDRRSTVR